MNLTKDEHIEQFYKIMPKNEFEYHVHISTRNSYIYFEVPKVACSTTKITLQNLEARSLGKAQIDIDISKVHIKSQSPLISPRKIGASQFFQMLGNPNIFKFTFVRNPYTRILSAYLSKIYQRVNNQTKKVTNVLNRDHSTKLTFEDFVEAISLMSVRDMDPHWRIQKYHTFFDLVDYNYIAKFESFSDNFKTILDVITTQTKDKCEIIDLRHFYPSKVKNAESKLEEFYNRKIANQVYQIYQDDFLAFGYEKELPKI